MSSNGRIYINLCGEFQVQSNKAEIGGGGGGSNPLHEQQRNQQIAPAAATPKSPNNVPNKPQDPSGTLHHHTSHSLAQTGALEYRMRQKLAQQTLARCINFLLKKVVFSKK